MPIYEYKCDKCEVTVERLQQIGDNPPLCPECGEGMVKKLTFPAMIKMKGMGGYPSRRKEWKGTAPYTKGYDSTRDKNSEWYKGQA